MIGVRALVRSISCELQKMTKEFSDDDVDEPEETGGTLSKEQGDNQSEDDVDTGWTLSKEQGDVQSEDDDSEQRLWEEKLIESLGKGNLGDIVRHIDGRKSEWGVPKGITNEVRDFLEGLDLPTKIDDDSFGDAFRVMAFFQEEEDGLEEVANFLEGVISNDIVDLDGFGKFPTPKYHRSRGALCEVINNLLNADNESERAVMVGGWILHELVELAGSQLLWEFDAEYLAVIVALAGRLTYILPDFAEWPVFMKMFAMFAYHTSLAVAVWSVEGMNAMILRHGDDGVLNEIVSREHYVNRVIVLARQVDHENDDFDAFVSARVLFMLIMRKEIIRPRDAWQWIFRPFYSVYTLSTSDRTKESIRELLSDCLSVNAANWKNIKPISSWFGQHKEMEIDWDEPTLTFK